MKELSKEEKAKAYDRVSKEVKDFFEGRQKMYSDVEQTLEYLFPDLKESKEEKAHHFDYRGLIEKNLAVAVTPENNPYIKNKS